MDENKLANKQEKQNGENRFKSQPEHLADLTGAMIRKKQERREKEKKRNKLNSFRSLCKFPFY